jgi:hypothetical protein
VFNLDAIQLQAAMVNQTEQLGKVTSAAQLMGIVNDIARLRVKQDILDLEAAIASKNDQAIIAATNKLNADLKVLGALQMQNIKLVDIKKILESIVPKDLIDQANLDLALLKIQQMLALLAKVNTATGTPNKPPPPEEPFKNQPIIPKLTGKESMDAILEYSDAVTALANVMADTINAQNYADFISLVSFQKKLGDFGGYSLNMNTGAGYGANSGAVNITITDRTSGLIQIVQDAVIQNNKYGNALVSAGSL